jgi:hypothetical protein
MHVPEQPCIELRGDGIKGLMATDLFHPAPIDMDMPVFLFFLPDMYKGKLEFRPRYRFKTERVKTGSFVLLVNPTRQDFART